MNAAFRLRRWLARWRPEDRWACLAAYALLLVWCAPLYAASDTRGSIGSDWEWFLAFFEAARRTIVDHGQLPAFNCWNYLGAPLWANPQVGPASHYTALVLLCGPVLGIKLGMVLSYLLSFECGRWLGRELFRTPDAAVLAGLLYALNTGIAAHFTRGHLCFGAYPFAPLLVLCCLRLPRWRWAGAGAGAVAGLMIQYGVHYYLSYVLLLAGLLTIAVAIARRAGRALLRFGALFVLGVLLVAGSRLLPLLAVVADYPRKAALPVMASAEALYRMFIVPALGPPMIWLQVGRPPNDFPVASWEFFAYAGFGVLLLALISLRWGVRFYHVGLALAAALMIGNFAWWHPSRWLALVPPFDSLWLVLRWRVVVLACLALAAARGLDQLLIWAGDRPLHSRLVRAAGWLLPLELVLLLFPAWSQYVCPYRDVELTRANLGLPETPHPLAIRRWVLPRSRKQVQLGLVRTNIGYAVGYEPLFSYGAAPTARRYIGKAGYRGEYQLGDAARPVKPAYWSPNRIRFEGLPPGELLDVNINPGRGWSLNGAPIFTEMRVFELERPFAVKVPASGVVDLRYRPPGLLAGVLSSVGAGALLALFAWFVRRSARRESSPAGEVSS